MSNFNKCFEKVILSEGGYVNDPDDKGGETYLGISRRNNPNWYGWKTIDDIKKKYPNKSINGLLKYYKTEDILKLKEEAKILYKTNYWDVLHLDEIHKIKVCHQLFDTAVNMGIRTAISIAQQLCGMTITGKFSDELLHNLKKL